MPLDSVVNGKPADQIDGDLRVANLFLNLCGQSIDADGKRADGVIPFDFSAFIYQRVRSIELALQVLADSLLEILVEGFIA